MILGASLVRGAGRASPGGRPRPLAPPSSLAMSAGTGAGKASGSPLVPLAGVPALKKSLSLRWSSHSSRNSNRPMPKAIASGFAMCGGSRRARRGVGSGMAAFWHGDARVSTRRGDPPAHRR